MQQRQLRAKWLLRSPRFFAFVSSFKLSGQLPWSVRFVFVSTFSLQRGRAFEQIGCLCKGKSSGRPRASEENVRRIQESFGRSPRKSTRRMSRELEIPQPTVWRVLRRRLLFYWGHLFESPFIYTCLYWSVQFTTHTSAPILRWPQIKLLKLRTKSCPKSHLDLQCRNLLGGTNGNHKTETSPFLWGSTGHCSDDSWKVHYIIMVRDK